MSSSGGAGDDFTLTFLGCGNLGIAILSGILYSLADLKSTHGAENTTTLPSELPNKFIACVTSRPGSINRLRKELGHFDANINFLQDQNVQGVRQAGAVILGCKPYHLAKVLGEPGMREALAGKLLISILAGVSVDQMYQTLYPESESRNADASKAQDRCRIVRAMPNTAALIQESMTVIAAPEPPLPENLQNLVHWIFTRIGRVTTLPAGRMDACTAVCGSGPATYLMVLEAMADGAVAMGIPRAEAQLMAAQTMKGAAGLVLNGEHPALLREKVSTPGGCTIGGLLVLEEGGVRGTVARSVREAAGIAAELGKVKKGVNGTRFPR